jgi:uncharacterized protein YecA (UPF0149 family)
MLLNPLANVAEDPSERAVKCGQRVVGGDKELQEKLGNNDLCPCGSGHSFQALLSQ